MSEHAEAEIGIDKKAEFDTGYFTIDFLSTDPHGFDIQTRNSLPRRDRDLETNLPTTPLALTAEQRSQLRKGMGNEAYFSLPQEFPQDKKPAVKKMFQLIDEVATLKENGATKEETQDIRAQLDELRAELRPLLKRSGLQNRLGLKVGVRNVQKVGIRHINRLGNMLLLDTRPVSYPVYAVASSPKDTDQALDLGAVTGTAGILITSDNKMVLQHRSEKNSPYGDMPGASFAGMLDAHFLRIVEGDHITRTGTLEPIDTDYVKNSSATERYQEIAVDDKEISDFRIVGKARDHVREHDEFLLLAKSSLTAAQVAERTENAPRSINNPKKVDEQGDFHFGENFIIIDATPEAIETLVTQVKCPRPPTHDAAFIATGYNILLEKTIEEGGGLIAANLWRDALQEKVRKNYEEMDQIVRDYYLSHPEQLQANKPGKPKRNPNGYEPYYLPGEQGLPSFQSELIRTGLVKKNIKSAEPLRSISNASIFDVDGVITNPETRRVEHEEIIDRLAMMINNDEFVGLNTGRSLAWVEKGVVDLLEGKIQDKNKLRNLIVVGEKGACWVTYDTEGRRTTHVDGDIAIPDIPHPTNPERNSRDDLQNAIAQYIGTMFNDSTKIAMFTAEQGHGVPNTAFKKDQADLVTDIHAIFAEYGLSEKFRVDATRIATDIESKLLGKDLGMRRILTYAQEELKIKPGHIDTFGDSKSDIEMAKEAVKQGFDTSFICVGGKELANTLSDDDTRGMRIVAIEGLDQGTLSHLQSRS